MSEVLAGAHINTEIPIKHQKTSLISTGRGDLIDLVGIFRFEFLHLQATKISANLQLLDLKLQTSEMKPTAVEKASSFRNIFGVFECFQYLCSLAP